MILKLVRIEDSTPTEVLTALKRLTNALEKDTSPEGTYT